MKNVKVNTNISFETLKGLISRATDSEKLWVADEWLRENKAISVEQYHELRDVWNKMFRKFGTWKIVISCGSVHYDYAWGTYSDLLKVCEDSHWEHNYNNGCVWDMELEEA